jgi:hypothetical protein
MSGVLLFGRALPLKRDQLAAQLRASTWVADLLARHLVRTRRLLSAMGLAAEEAGFLGLCAELAELSARDGVPLLAS